MAVKTEVVTLDSGRGHNGVANGGHYGLQSWVWVSRPELVLWARVVKEEHKSRPGRLTWHEDIQEVEIAWDEDNFGPRDYILVQWRTRSQLYSDREGYKLIAGVMPAWADFPGAWKRWVNEVEGEAKRFLLRYGEYFPELRRAVEYALRKGAKNTKHSAWLSVQTVLEGAGLLRYSPEHTYSWTGVIAMPVKIAWAIDAKKSPIGRWRPSVPKPKYQDKPDGVRFIGPYSIPENLLASHTL